MAINRHMCLGLSFPTGCADARSLARSSEGGLQLSAPQRHHHGAGRAASRPGWNGPHRRQSRYPRAIQAFAPGGLHGAAAPALWCLS